ncbi:DNA polymerase III PolC-type OS=Lysinibacillus sphaericus OX=1421 GN=polC PE=3 SV=1 [Lysinibacillus sphaericus]
MAPTLKNCLVSQIPMWNGQKITLSCVQEMELMMLKTKYAEKLALSYSQFGFPQIAFDFMLQEETEEMREAQEAFIEQKRLEEAAMAQQAMQDFQKREQDKKDNPALAALGDRHFSSVCKLKTMKLWKLSA